MLLKAGVDISRLERNTRRSLGTVEALFREIREEMVITSTYEGNHGAGSLHYANQAYDVRLSYANQANIFKHIKEGLGNDFDVVWEENHIHIEYDPK